MRKKLYAVLGIALWCLLSVGGLLSLQYNCCDEPSCVDCSCLQCFLNLNNATEPCVAIFDVPQKLCQKVVVYQAALNLLEPTFEIDQPPKILI